MYAREAHFYRELAPRLSLRTPRCFFASDDLLVMEDLAPAAAGTFSEGLRDERVDAVIDAFVAMHGEWQGSEELGRLDWLWRVSDEEARRWQQNLEGRLPRFVDRHRDALTDDDVRAAELVTANLAALMTAAAALPATLCHGDPGAPNLMFVDRGAEPAFVDWQLASARERCPRPRVVARPRCLRPLRTGNVAIVWLGRYRDRLGLDVEAFGRAHALGVALAVRAPIWMGGAPDRERTGHVDAYAAATIPRAFAAFAAEEGRHQWLT